MQIFDRPSNAVNFFRIVQMKQTKILFSQWLEINVFRKVLNLLLFFARKHNSIAMSASGAQLEVLNSKLAGIQFQDRVVTAVLR